MDCFELLMECGYNKPVAKVELGDKPNIIQTVTLHKVVLASLAELSQFRNGLSAIGVLPALKEYPFLLSPYYSIDDINDQLTSGILACVAYLSFTCTVRCLVMEHYIFSSK